MCGLFGALALRNLNLPQRSLRTAGGRAIGPWCRSRCAMRVGIAMVTRCLIGFLGILNQTSGARPAVVVRHATCAEYIVPE